MTTVDDRLTALRPTPQFTQEEVDAVLERVLNSASEHRLDEPHLALARPRRRRRRTSTVTVLTGLAAAAAVVAPTLLPVGSPGGSQAAAAAGLHRLAVVAATSAFDTIGPHAYWHVVFRHQQAASASTPAGQSQGEYWTSGADGREWLRIGEKYDGSKAHIETYLLLPDKTDPNYPSVRNLRSLPTDPDALLQHLRRTTNGSPTVDEAIFSAVPDLLRSGIAPLALRRAAIEMLADLGHITIGSVTRDAAGNPVQEFVFRDDRSRPDQAQSIMFDTRTAQLTEERQYVHGKVVDQDWTERQGAVASVPAAIRAAAVPTH